MLATLKELVHESETLPLLPASETSQFSQYLNISSRWISTGKEYLPLITALASRPFDSAAPSAQLGLRHVAVYLLLGLRNRVNHHTLHQGVAALLSYHQLKQQSAHNKPRCAAIAKQLNRCALPYWAANLLPPAVQPSACQDIMAIAWLWYRYLLRSPHADFNNILQKLSLLLPAEGLQQLSSLLPYPGLIHEGMTISSEQQAALVLSQLPDKVLLYRREHKSPLIWIDKRKITVASHQRMSVQDWLNGVQTLENQPAEGEVQTLADHRWALPKSYPTGKPPASLQALLRALNDPDVAIQKIVDLVAAEPAFSQFLTAAASQDNRMQLTVQNVKQSILTYGLERVGNMLVQHALFQRLIQHQFPLLSWYSRFARIAVVISSELACASNAVTPQYASLVTTVTVSPLFTSSALKCRVSLFNCPERLFDIATLIEPVNHSTGSKVRQQLMSLATAWEQDKGQSRLIACCGKMPGDVPSLLRLPHCITGLSLIWARQWLFGQRPCSQTTEFIQQTQRAYPELLALKASIIPKVSSLLSCPLR